MARHSTLVPKKNAELAVKRIERTCSIDGEESLDPRTHFVFGVFKFRKIGRRSFSHLAGEIIRQRIRQNKITVSQALHKCTGPEPVRAVIRKIRFADHKQTRHIAHQIVIDPRATHRVMDCGVNSHRHLIGVFTGDLFIDFKQISVAFANRIFAKALNRVGKIEIHASSTGTDAAALIANFLRCA